MKRISDYKQTISWYNKNANDYAQKIQTSPNEDLIQRFLSKLEKGSKILDAGSAGGRDCKIFMDEGFIPIGLDISPSFINISKEKYPDIHFIAGSFLNIPFDNNSFDGVWAHASLVHFEKIDEVKTSLSEFYRVLKLGGIAHIFVKQQLDEEKTQQISHSYSEEFKRFFRFFTKEELKTYLKEANFTILDLQDSYTSQDGRKEIKWIAALIQKN